MNINIIKETRKKNQTKPVFFACILAWESFFFKRFSANFVLEIAKIYSFSLFFLFVKKVNYVPFVIVPGLIKSE